METNGPQVVTFHATREVHAVGYPVYPQWATAGLSNWRPAGRIRPAGRVDPAREAKLDFCNIVEMLTIDNTVINAYLCS